MSIHQQHAVCRLIQWSLLQNTNKKLHHHLHFSSNNNNTQKHFFHSQLNFQLKDNKKSSTSHKKSFSNNKHRQHQQQQQHSEPSPEESISNISSNNFNMNSIATTGGTTQSSSAAAHQATTTSTQDGTTTNKPSSSSFAQSPLYIDPHNTFQDQEDDYIPSSSYIQNNKPSSSHHKKPSSTTTTTTNTDNTTTTDSKSSNLSYQQVITKRNEIMDTLEFYRRMKRYPTTTSGGGTAAGSSSSSINGGITTSGGIGGCVGGITGDKSSQLFEVYREVKFFLKEFDNEKLMMNQLHVAESLLDKLIDTIRECSDVETGRILLNLLKSRIESLNDNDTPEQAYLMIQQLKLKPKITKLLSILINSTPNMEISKNGNYSMDLNSGLAQAISFIKNAKNGQQTAPYLSTSAFTVIFNGLIKQLKIFNPKCEHNLTLMKRAMELFNWMNESEQALIPPPDAFVFTSLIRGFCLIGDMMMVMELFNQMSTEYGMKVPVLTKDIIMEGYIRVGSVEKAFEFFKLNCGEEYDGYYNSLITGFTHEGSLNKAFDLVDEMKLKNISITTETYNSFLLGLFKSRNYSQLDIDTILRTMLNSNLKPNSKTHGLVIRCLIQQGRLNESIQYYAQHPEAILGAKTIASTLMKAGRLEEAENLMNQMLDSYRRYKIETHVMHSVMQYLIKVLLSIGSVKKAAFWRKQIPRIYKRD